MEQEEKQLLIKDLCARLPYGVIVDNPESYGGAWDEVINIDNSAKTVTLLYNGRVFSIDDVKPYLRPMSSMTEEEKIESGELYKKNTGMWDDLDWLNAHHFDYRGLIECGLALEAPEGMYKIK